MYNSTRTLTPQFKRTNTVPYKGNKVTEAQNQYEKYNAQLDAFKKKWTSVSREIKESYENLMSQLTIRKDLENKMEPTLKKA